jgi:hypothetical protein
MFRAVVKIGDGDMLKLDSGSDGDGDGSGSDLVNHGALRATRVATSRKTSCGCPRGLDRRHIQQKSNEWRTPDDARTEAAPVYIDAAAWCTRAPPTGAGEHKSVTREREKHHFREC